MADTSHASGRARFGSILGIGACVLAGTTHAQTFTDNTSQIPGGHDVPEVVFKVLGSISTPAGPVTRCAVFQEERRAPGRV